MDATCPKKKQYPCGKGQTPLEGYFCGRGVNRQDCPSTHQCVIAPNDSYAVCCPVVKAGSCPAPKDGVMGICIARCAYDNECEGNLKCCGGCPRECVAPVL